jgi:hypothetical protein
VKGSGARGQRLLVELDQEVEERFPRIASLPARKLFRLDDLAADHEGRPARLTRYR